MIVPKPRETFEQWCSRVGERSGLPVKPLFIPASPHPIAVVEPGRVVIGCTDRPLAWWESPEGLAFAKEKGYSDTRIEVYRAHLAYCRLWMEDRGLLYPPVKR